MKSLLHICINFRGKLDRVLHIFHHISFSHIIKLTYKTGRKVLLFVHRMVFILWFILWIALIPLTSKDFHSNSIFFSPNLRTHKKTPEIHNKHLKTTTATIKIGKNLNQSTIILLGKFNGLNTFEQLNILYPLSLNTFCSYTRISICVDKNEYNIAMAFWCWYHWYRFPIVNQFNRLSRIFFSSWIPCSFFRPKKKLFKIWMFNSKNIENFTVSLGDENWYQFNQKLAVDVEYWSHQLSRWLNFRLRP